MQSECYQRLQPILSEYLHVYQFLNDGFIRGQCESALKNFLLKRLDNEESSHFTCQHLPTLEQRLAGLTSITGYDRLKPLLRGASDWDEYQEFLAQIDITLFFKHKNLLKEIEPELPHRAGNADFLLSFSQQDIYCEVTSFESLAKSIESLTKDGDNKIESKFQKVRKEQPWITRQDIENETEVNRIAKNLLEKTKRQLPLNHLGILALETGKSQVYCYKIKEVAKKLFPKRPQVTLIMLWSLEKGSQIGEAPFWFVNPNSPYQNIGRKLLEHLGQDNKVIS